MKSLNCLNFPEVSPLYCTIDVSRCNVPNFEAQRSLFWHSTFKIFWFTFNILWIIFLFLDTQVSLAPTHVCLSVSKSVGHTFGFLICQRLWPPYVKSEMWKVKCEKWNVKSEKSNYFKNPKFFQKSNKFPKIQNFSTNPKLFQKSESFSNYPEFFLKSKKNPKIQKSRNPEIQNIIPKSGRFDTSGFPVALFIAEI